MNNFEILADDSIVEVPGTAEADSLESDKKYSYVRGYAGDDTISVVGSGTLGNSASNSYIDAGDDNDMVTIGARNSTVFGGAGNDSITISKTASIYADGGAGNDHFLILEQDSSSTLTSNITLVGGAGNDIFELRPSDGDRSSLAVLIKDFSTDDIFQIDDN